MDDLMPVSVTGAQPASQALTTTIGDALAAQVQAGVSARYTLAMRRPRDLDRVRLDLLKDCQRPRFAQVARYAKPVGGKKMEGPSIRFVEAALRHFRNVLPESMVIFDDERRRIVRVSVTDLENNITYSQDVAIDKTVERRNGEGRQILGQRSNTSGETVFIVLATEDELTTKQAALVSKALRTSGLRLLPGDLVDEAMDAIIETRRRRDAEDPDALRKRLAGDFAAVGVTPEQLKEYLGHGLEVISEKEGAALWDILCALRDGEARWADVMGERVETPAAPAQPAEPRRRGSAMGVAAPATAGGEAGK